MTTFFRYGTQEMDFLSGADPAMGTLIARHGKLRRKVTPDLFTALAESIIGQQISTAAAATVNNRLATLCQSITPESIANARAAHIQQCGMTHRKAGYLIRAAEAFLAGDIDPQELRQLSDAEVITRLTRLAGVGRWTAEMLLLHALQRPDVFSYDDLVIRRSLMLLHGLKHLDKSTFELYRRMYSPYCSVAMIYLWRHGARL